MGVALTVSQSGLDWVEPISALAGAVVGGLIAYLTTRSFENRRLKELRLVWAYAIVFKLARLTDDIEQTERHLINCWGPLGSLTSQDALWQRMTDFVGFSDVEIVFSAEELALIANMKDQQLTMDLMELEAGHRIVTGTLRQMTGLRQKLAESGFAKEINGNVVTFEATQEQLASISPLLINLDSFARSLVKNVPELTALGRATCNTVGPKLKNHYKFGSFVSLSVDDSSKSAKP